MDQPVKRTPLYEIHQRLGARMTSFGGFAMPLQYRGILEEHRAVRTAAGIFDLSHMGEFEVLGARALDLLERALTNSAARLGENQAQYTLMCGEDGGTIDDLIVYRLAADRFLLCVNAANIRADWQHLSEISGGAALFDRSDETALIAIQGPLAIKILARLAVPQIDNLRRFHTQVAEIAGAEALIARTGYTGEDGFELFIKASDATTVFEAVLESGRDSGLMPCGLGARDTLRMEAGLPLYGHELDRRTTPFEAGLRPFVKLGRSFIGERALAKQNETGPPRNLIGLRTDDGRSIARQGYSVICDGAAIGVVTSGTYAPTFERPLAMALVKSSAKVAPGQTLEVEIRHRPVPATVVPLPYYRREKLQELA